MDTENTKETKTVFKAIFAWDDEKEEKWLEQMAASGWHLKSVAPYFYTFQRGDPETVIYRLDYKFTMNKDYGEYAAIFQDSGWELVSMMGNWHYYRIKTGNNSTPEIYNSGRTKAQKYRRLLMGLLPLLLFFLIILNPIRLLRHEDQGAITTVFDGINLIMIVLMVVIIYAVIRIAVKIRNLESQSKE